MLTTGRAFVAVLAVVMCLMTATANSAVVALHQGNTDPLTEGWDAPTLGPGVAVGAVTNDLGLGIDAWFTDDNSAAALFPRYKITPTAGEISDATAFGWKASINLRVVDVNDAQDSSVIFEYGDNSRRFLVEFGTDSNGDATVQLFTGSSGATFFGPTFSVGDAGYHLYELIFDPILGSADLFVDGIERISDYTGEASATNRIVWGALSSFGTGQGNYNLVQFETLNPVPLPAALPLFAGGLGLLGLLGWRRQRTTTA